MWFLHVDVDGVDLVLSAFTLCDSPTSEARELAGLGPFFARWLICLLFHMVDVVSFFHMVDAAFF